MAIYNAMCIVNQYPETSHAYAVVEDFLDRDSAHALFRIKTKTWPTHGVLCKPGRDTSSLLVVPAVMAVNKWSSASGDYLCASAPQHPIHWFIHLVDAVHVSAKGNCEK